jgi:hypothetical protein
LGGISLVASAGPLSRFRGIGKEIRYRHFVNRESWAKVLHVPVYSTGVVKVGFLAVMSSVSFNAFNAFEVLLLL